MEQLVTAVPAYAAGGTITASGHNEAHSSAVSWAAVIGGAFVSAALSVILLALGAALGLSAVSPWSNTGATASAMSSATIIWLMVMEIIACGMGGYLAGRLRTRWVNVHTDEVFFRDTAHGFLVWAVGLVISASFLASAATSMVGGAAQAGVAGVALGGSAAAGVAANAATSGTATAGPGVRGGTDPNAYFVDTLFRTDSPAAVDNSNGGAPVSDAGIKAEVGRIMATDLTQADFPAADQAYIAKRVAARTGLSQADADKRVADVIGQAEQAQAKARQAADDARLAATHGLLWIFVSLLMGAFCASFAATIGGRQRDQLKPVAVN
jgi:hypothetical protein